MAESEHPGLQAEYGEEDVARFPQRINSPAEEELPALERRLAEGEPLIVQFVGSTYTPGLLARLDALCARFGEKLELRFYGHDGLGFDGRTLAAIPNVANLSVDCLQQAEHTDVLGALPCLKKLSLGVAHLRDDHILRFPNLRGLHTLSLGETDGKQLELAHLGGMPELASLLVCRHDRGLSVIKTLPKLRKLQLNSMGKGVHLEFLSQMRLRSLCLALGGRVSIAEIEGPALTKLELTRVKGLADLGDLARFPALRSFSLEDQPQISRIEFGGCSSLETVRVINCKGVTEITGLEKLARMGLLTITRTAMGPAALLALRLPQNLTICVFATTRETENRALRQALEARGYTSA